MAVFTKTSKADIAVESNSVFSVTTDRGISYEYNKPLYVLTLPVMWLLAFWVFCKKAILRRNPKINTFWFDGLSLPCRRIKEGAASWRALDIIYNFRFGSDSRISDYWLGIINAQAVRNRFKLVKHELKQAIRQFNRNESEVRILSLASGSAQPVIEAMAEMRPINVKAVFVDLDPTAIEYSRQMAKAYGMENQITFLVGSVTSLDKLVQGGAPHIIEMVGFLDYRPRDKAILLVKKIWKVLPPDGLFVTANTCPNSEMSFLKWVINWSMIYRKPEDLRDILLNAGFSPEDCRITLEPHGIHAVAMCTKKLV